MLYHYLHTWKKSSITCCPVLYSRSKRGDHLKVLRWNQLIYKSIKLLSCLCRVPLADDGLCSRFRDSISASSLGLISLLWVSIGIGSTTAFFSGTSWFLELSTFSFLSLLLRLDLVYNEKIKSCIEIYCHLDNMENFRTYKCKTDKHLHRVESTDSNTGAFDQGDELWRWWNVFIDCFMLVIQGCYIKGRWFDSMFAVM